MKLVKATIKKEDTHIITLFFTFFPRFPL
jgi:hypothetical protein